MVTGSVAAMATVQVKLCDLDILRVVGLLLAHLDGLGAGRWKNKLNHIYILLF